VLFTVLRQNDPRSIGAQLLEVSRFGREADGIGIDAVNVPLGFEGRVRHRRQIRRPPMRRNMDGVLTPIPV
jgi:hypothetical protein